MKLEDFKSGNRINRFQYKSFEPAPINHVWTWNDPAINTMLEYATRSLSELNAFSLIVPDIDLFIRMHVIKEAQSSSRIEGTQTGIDEVLMEQDQLAPNKRDDWKEVHNYIDAMNSSLEALKSLPLSNRLLRNAHKILLEGVRGEAKLPGEFRTSQNWIGGTSISDAVFIPPFHENLPDLMGDLESFLHNDEIHVPYLIRAAIVHYQFETIHPFLDGNGRIGRLLITLYLVEKGILSKPSLYLSDFFERNRAAYYDALMRVRVSNDMIHWVKFFLNGVETTAQKGRSTFVNILNLKKDVDLKIENLGRRVPLAKQTMNLFYQKPILTPLELSSSLDISHPTLNNLIRQLTQLGILEETDSNKRNRSFTFKSYLDLFLL